MEEGTEVAETKWEAHSMGLMGKAVSEILDFRKQDAAMKQPKEKV